MVNPVTGEGVAGPWLCACDGGALRDGAASVLRLSPAGRDRADGQSVPAGQGQACACPPQPDGSVFGRQRAGLYRPRQAQRIPRRIPDELFDELFAVVGSHRDRALVALWISTGARAAELLGVRCGDADPGSQLVTVIRKGSQAIQQLPASADAFVWLRLYQQQMHGLVRARRDDPLWWTRRRPSRLLAYHAARAMFTKGKRGTGRQLVAA